MTSSLRRRLAALEAKHGGPQRTFMTVMPPGMTEIEEAVFIASERHRLGMDENDVLYCVLTGVPRADGEKWKGPRDEQPN